MEEKIRKAAVGGTDILPVCFDYEIPAYETDEVLGTESLDEASSPS